MTEHSNRTRTQSRSSSDWNDDAHLKQESIRPAHRDRNKARRKQLRQRIKATHESSELRPDLVTARIIRAEGAHFIAQQAGGQELAVRTYRGTTTENPKSTLAAVGDEIRISLTQSKIHHIESVALRQTKLSRNVASRNDDLEQVIAANMDTLAIVAAITKPVLHPGILDRYLIAAQLGYLSPFIILNKLDEATEPESDAAAHLVQIYSALGIAVMLLSATSGEGMTQLREQLRGHRTIFAGHSGVGKTSIVNALLRQEVGRTGSLSKKYRKGAHTTVGATYLPIPDLPASYLVDTPGVREFANYDLDPDQLKFFFPEFEPLMGQCRITNCSHLHEPACAVLQAAQRGTIAMERYESYLKLFDEASARLRRTTSRS